ncbi:MAG: hypothetical protein QNL03_07255 [Gammaproteobacteria bacterium]|nr:hypothetical protein [Gammaproteobacteria bacterium]
MIDETIRISGKFQVEIKSDYKLERDRKHTTYTIETYAFVPNSLDVSHDTYPKYLFYRDTQTYIRFKIPTVLLHDIAAVESRPFKLLEDSLRDLVAKKTDETARSCENQIRLFCCVLKSSVKDYVALIGDVGSATDAGHLVEHYHTSLVKILSRFRKLAKNTGLSSMDERIRSIYAFADEYSSIFIEQNTFDILLRTRKFEDDNSAVHRTMLLKLIRNEKRYRTEKGYPSVASADTDNEEFLYRRGVLKRLMESILFLNTRVRAEGKITEQVIYSLAAGLAMVFATTVAFLTQQKYGNFTMAFFVALVVSYMLKDRLKEMGRLYVNKKVQGRFFDQKVHIYGGSGGNQLGFIREGFRFISEASLQPVIRSLRNRDPITLIDNERLGEKIILYRKSLQIFSRDFEQVYHGIPIDGLTDIWRVDMTRFVRKMDNPKKPLFVLDGEGYRNAKASKVYHINLVIRYVASHGEEFKRFRIVLNRGGIKRIETVENK